MSKKITERTPEPVMEFDSFMESLDIIDFDSEPIFVGKFIETVEVGEGDKAFTAHTFETPIGERVNLSDTYMVNKAIQKIQSNPTLKDKNLMIEFLEKTEVAGKPFRKFKIQIEK